jgi:hypothetical protein
MCENKQAGFDVLPSCGRLADSAIKRRNNRLYRFFMGMVAPKGKRGPLQEIELHLDAWGALPAGRACDGEGWATA